MPRAPKNIFIEMVRTELRQPTGYIQTGPDTAVPRHFEAHFVLGDPPARVIIEIFLLSGGRPAVIDMSIRSRTQDPITTTMLRRILVDQLVQLAMEDATVPLSVREEWIAREFPERARAESPNSATATSPERPRSRADEDARTAAHLYNEALASGSRAPAMAVVEKMNRSRAQVARYIRRARELGFLAPLT